MIPICILDGIPTPRLDKSFSPQQIYFYYFLTIFFVELSNLMGSYLGGNETDVTLEKQKTWCTLKATQILLSSWRNCRLIGCVCLVDLSTSVIFLKGMSRSLPKPCQTGSKGPCVNFFSLDLERFLGGQPLAMGHPNDRTSSNLGKLVFW